MANEATPGSSPDGAAISLEGPVAVSAGLSPETEIARAGRWPLVFVAGALLALAILPIVQEQRIADTEAEVSTILEPAGRLGHELTLLQSRQMARFQAYLLTGDPSLRLRHQELVARENEVHRELQALVEQADLAIRGPLAELSTVSRAWHLGHANALDGDAARETYLENIVEEQERYDAVLAAARRLEEAVDAQVAAGRRAMERERAFQVWLIVGLALLALVATGALVVIGWRVQLLVRQAENRRKEALRARRGMAAVLEATADGVVGIDLEGRCTTLNRTASDLLGYPEIDAQGRYVHELLHGKAEPEPHRPEECPVLRALRSGVAERETEDVVWRRDGTSFPAKWHLRPLLDGRDVKGAVVTITDMTEIREAEEALRMAVRAREEVVAVVSHDLRNPLGTVLAAADLITELDLDREKEREQITVIKRAAENMRRLIEDLLDVARIEEGGLSVEPRPERLERLVGEALDLVSLKAREQGVRLESSVPRDLVPVVVDGDRIIQVLSNLVGNAVKFTDRGGRVTIAAREEAGGVHVRVKDTGCGIAPEDLERLWDRFWQVREGDRQGTGLGLTIARGIVEAHGGRIWVESDFGRGSTFHFVLPRGGEESPAQARLSRRSRDRGA